MLLGLSRIAYLILVIAVIIYNPLKVFPAPVYLGVFIDLLILGLLLYPLFFRGVKKRGTDDLALDFGTFAVAVAVMSGMAAIMYGITGGELAVI